MEAAKARERKVYASPQRADFEKEFGKHNVKDEGGGKWSLSLRDKDQMKRAYEMQAGIRREEIERGEAVRAKQDGKRERVVRRDGLAVDLPGETIEQAKHRLRPAGRYGGAPSMRFMPMLGLAPVWSYICNECGEKNGMWRQWTEPEAVVTECVCGSNKLTLEEEVDFMDTTQN